MELFMIFVLDLNNVIVVFTSGRECFYCFIGGICVIYFEIVV